MMIAALAIVICIATAFGALGSPPPVSADVVAAQDAATTCKAAIGSQARSIRAAGGHTICFWGLIDQKSAAQFLELDMSDESLVVVNSQGGDISSALDMADFILARHASIVVDGFCASSCANYLFPAGVMKYVLDGSVLGFHGGALMTDTQIYNGPSSLRTDALAQGVEMHRDQVSRQFALFARIGVNPLMMFDGPHNISFTAADWHYSVWEYGPYALHDKFEVHGIRYFITPNHWSIGVRIRFWLSHFGCVRAGRDAWICKQKHRIATPQG